MYHCLELELSLIYGNFLLQINKNDQAELRSILEKCAGTSLNSKLIHQQKDFFAKMVVDAVTSLDTLLPLDMIGIKKVPGGALEVVTLFSNGSNYSF